ncbi:hypothetical protein L873DRAFT_1764008 [Choiromyces venosus 120613-1]|uniref:Uncharacterized protein n=1 Tax=Choiromyces venosus 120613-1 TaxID=1336337 RepID=A0A3N4JXT7_9PEZI|nr:hypothetical protein L873DRAFT_1764008 [Choiromyces venosus 120613-1]
MKISASSWKEMGYRMLDDQGYTDALRCFEEANDPHGILLATAYMNENYGLTKRVRGFSKEANLHFIDASESFLKAGRIKKAAQCRKEGGDQKGAVKILANSGAYEDAAWLAAENGLFSETSEIYTKLHKPEAALAAYALGKDFKRMFSYLKKFEPETEPCCWKQYIRFCYVERFGDSDGIIGEFEKKVLSRIGSLKEQEMILSRYNLANKLFDLRNANKKYMEAYEGGVSSGLLEKSIQLLSDQALLRTLSLEQGARLYVACKYLQAEHIATNSWPKPGEDWQIHKVLQAAVGRGSAQIDSFVKRWKDINQALKSFVESGTGVEIGKLDDVQIAGYVDILVTRGVRVRYNKLPPELDNIERVLEDLWSISSHGLIPSSPKLYCGIYEIPDRPDKHIILEQSPLNVNSNKRLPLMLVNIENKMRRRILRHILSDIAPPLVSLDEDMQEIWSKKSSNLAETHPQKVELLVRLNQIFSKSSLMIEETSRLKETLSLDWDWVFWRVALLEEMEFRSPSEQNLNVLFDTRTELNRIGEYRSSYSVLLKDDTIEHRMKSAARLGVGACVSSLLAQYQTSLFLDYRGPWRLVQLQMRNQIRDSGFQSASEMVTLMNRFLFETEAGDFPWRFCDNIHNVLGALARSKNTLNFYSASVISLYEELALSLISLVRPHEFLVPDSWRRLYFNRWENKHRSPSGRERFWYQRYLINVCLSFCEMVVNIERTPTEEIALAKRSVTLIVVCLINLGTCCPRPQGYAELWRKSQEVFNRNRLNAKGIRNLRADELIGRLANVFRGYNGNDSIILMRGYQLQRIGDSFAGFPLQGTGISVVKRSSTREKERHPREPSTDQETRRLNAAHILTVFWKLDGPRFVERMRECRRYLAPRYKNCCLLADMREDKNWTY